MMVRLKLFAVARQMAGADWVELQLPPEATVADLRSALIDEVPALAPLAGHLTFAVNEDYAADSTPIPAGADVACIPPVSGG